MIWGIVLMLVVFLLTMGFWTYICLKTSKEVGRRMTEEVPISALIEWEDND